MKYIFELLIILLVSLTGEILKYFIPLPIPASIYGLVIMLVLLCTGILKLDRISDTGDWLIKVMPLMFIPGGVGVITVWDELKPVLIPVIVITVVSLIVTMVVTGKVTEFIIKRRGGKENE